MEKTVEVERNLATFWSLYDRFCEPTHLTTFINEGVSDQAEQMRSATRAIHLDRTIHNLSRPQLGWNHHMAWLALSNAPIRNDMGQNVLYMRVGDVVIVEHGWDRDVIITHAPIDRNLVRGYLLSGRHEEMIGLFMPLFERYSILECIQLRMKKNVREATELAYQESDDWGWY